MSNYMSKEERRRFIAKVLSAAAQLFLEKGYSKSSTREIAEKAGIHISSMKQYFGPKENILAELVQMTLERQFICTEAFLEGKTDDPILFYAAETTLQLYIVESNENIRELYAAAYSMPITTKIIQDTLTAKLEDIFKEHLPHLESKDFFEREIASGGIIRSFMTIPCGRYFTMKRKVAAYLESAFKIYDVPPEKIQEAINFVSQFDFEKIAEQTIEIMLESMQSETVAEQTIQVMRESVKSRTGEKNKQTNSGEAANRGTSV